MNWIFALVVLAWVAVSFVIFWFGYRSGSRASQSYMEAARALSSSVLAEQSRASLVKTSLDELRAAVLELKNAVDGTGTTSASGYKRVEDALYKLLTGFERAGVVTRRERAGRQVGEEPRETG